MESPSFIQKTIELPSTEDFTADLPPLLGALPKNSEKYSYDYYNILELEKCQVFCHTIYDKKASFEMCHYYDEEKYKDLHFSIHTPTTKTITQPNRNGQEVEDLYWLDMNAYQIFFLINSMWGQEFKEPLLKFNRENRYFSIKLPPGMEIQLCHKKLWVLLGFSESKLVKHNLSRSDYIKYPGMTTKIFGIRNTTTDYLTLTGKQVAYTKTFFQRFPDIGKVLERGQPERIAKLFMIVRFPISPNHYTKMEKYTFNFELANNSTTNFMHEMETCIKSYGNKVFISEDYLDDIPEDFNRITITEMKPQKMVLTITDNFRVKRIYLYIKYDKFLTDFLQTKETVIKSLITTLNLFTHSDILTRNVYKFPFYLISKSKNMTSELDESSIKNKNLYILGIFDDNGKVISPQNPLKLRPNSYNKLVFTILDRDLEPILNRITCDLLFRFKREFIEENQQSHFIPSFL